MQIVVAGAGYLGSRVLAALPERLRTAITRSAIDVPGVVTLLADFDDVGPPFEFESPYALLYTVPPPGSGDDDPRLERLLARLDRSPERLVYVGTTGVYGDRGGSAVTEEDPVRAATDRARRRVAAERLAADWCEQRAVSCILLRVPGIYGPGRLGIDRLAEGAEILREADSGPGNRIHIDDLTACCVAALTGDAPPGIYNVGDGDHRSSSAFSLAVARQAGIPAPREISLAEAERRWSAMRLSFARESRRVATDKMRRVLGVAPAFADPEDGIRASLEAQ